MRLTVFDVESTGVNVFEDRIVQLYIGVYDDNGDLEADWESLMNPGIEIPTEASDIHGFTTEIVQDFPPSKDMLLEARDVFLEHRQIPWIAFNMNYDLSILDEEFKRHGISETFGAYARDAVQLFDPLVVDRAMDRYRKGKRNLEAMAAHYGIPFDADAAHKADYDVAVTAKVALAVMERYGLPSTREQAQWQEAWRANFQDYLRKTDPTATVERGWPLRLKEEA